MKNKKNIVAIAMLSLSAPITSTLAFAEGVFSVTSGADYSTGKYGQSESTDITYIPFVGKYETDLTTIRLTVPWLQITGPGDVVGSDATLISNSTNRKRMTESGLGDIVFALTQTIANIGESRPLVVDLTGKVKFATASSTNRLGTGENDYTITLDGYKPINNGATLFGGLGYKKTGDPKDINLNNVWSGSCGLSYKLNQKSSTGIMADYRQASINNSEPLREITAFFTHKFSTTYKLQSYLTHGYSDASTDWGGGLMLGYIF
ncbi:MAG: hypothetical protein U1C48_00385 [Methylotenera sp.]|nr:hypothetical protein [Methylotenera sp.]